jgi:hypothetical protein
MAPKKAVAKSVVNKDGDKERKDISNMLTQAKNPKASDDQKNMLQLYQSYPRFDARKKEMLNKWRGDKTCSWVSQYSEVSSKSNEVDNTSLHGYGTLCLS